MGERAALVEMEHVHVARGNRVVLHDVSLRLEEGEHVAILGPNGCGKSTLLKTMTCELYPLARPETRVRVFGRERWDVTQLRRRMGVVSPELPGRQTLHTTGFDAILTGFFSSSTLWPNLTVTDAMRARAEEIVPLVGGDKLRDVPVGEMSAGQQRRMMIGRALAGASELLERAGEGAGVPGGAVGVARGGVKMLLLDEPSNALDLAAQRDLREMLRKLAQAGTAVVMITHHVQDILPEMRRVVMMSEGRVVADGAKAELLTAERLGELFGGEIHLVERDGWWAAW